MFVEARFAFVPIDGYYLDFRPAIGLDSRNIDNTNAASAATGRDEP
jgi:hypothetical protein